MASLANRFCGYEYAHHATMEKMFHRACEVVGVLACAVVEVWMDMSVVCDLHICL